MGLMVPTNIGEIFKPHHIKHKPETSKRVWLGFGLTLAIWERHIGVFVLHKMNSEHYVHLMENILAILEKVHMKKIGLISRIMLLSAI